MNFTPLEHLGYEINTTDATLEFIAIMGYLFVILMAFYARKRNKIFATKGFTVLIFAIILGLFSAIMDFLSELYFIDEYEKYKLLGALLQIVCLILIIFALLLTGKFTKFLLGNEE